VTKTNATLATIGCVIGAPLLLFGVVWLFQQELFLQVLGLFCAGLFTLVILVIASCGLYELWKWFRSDGWSQKETPASSETVSGES
jgi:multisubunit Na+/H+ antiporter MnhG subunit